LSIDRQFLWGPSLLISPVMEEVRQLWEFHGWYS